MASLAYGAPAPPVPVPVPGCQVIILGNAFIGKGPKVVDAAGIRRTYRDLIGWWNPSPSTGSMEQRAYQSGGYPSPAYSRPRNLALKGNFLGDDPVALLAALESFLGALTIDELFPFVVIEEGLERHVRARMEGEPIVTWRGAEAASFDVQFVAPDYRRLSGDGTAPTYSLETGLPTQTGGLAFPVVFPAVFDADVVTGIVEITNRGTAPPPVTVKIHGPASDPIIRTGDGQSMPFKITLDEGQFLEVNLDRRTVMLNGQASRRSALRGGWATLRPGANVLMFDAASYNPGTRITVDWYDAWK